MVASTIEEQDAAVTQTDRPARHRGRSPWERYYEALSAGGHLRGMPGRELAVLNACGEAAGGRRDRSFILDLDALAAAAEIAPDEAGRAVRWLEELGYLSPVTGEPDRRCLSVPTDDEDDEAELERLGPEGAAAAEAIRGLTTREREWLARHACDGESMEEIAVSEGISHQAVSKAVRRAKAKLAAAGVSVDRLAPMARPKAKITFLPMESLSRLENTRDSLGSVYFGRWTSHN